MITNPETQQSIAHVDRHRDVVVRGRAGALISFLGSAPAAQYPTISFHPAILHYFQQSKLIRRKNGK